MLKRMLWVILIVAVFAVLIVPGFLKEQVRKGLADAFPEARVSLGALGLERPLALALTDIRIHHKQYEISARKILIDRDLRLTLIEPTASLQALPQMSRAAADSERARPRQGGLSISSIRAHGLNVEYRIDGIAADLRGDVVYDPRSERFVRVDLDVPSLQRGDLQIKDAAIRIGSEGQGQVTVSSVAQQKVRLTDIRATAHLTRTALVLSDLDARLASGKVTGTVRVDLAAPARYTADLRIALMDLAVLSKDLAIDEKVGLSGLLDGHITLSGDVTDVQQLTGELRGTEAGGDLVIQDRATLEHLAKNIRQPLDLVEAAFKEYHFDTSSAVLELAGDDLGIKVHLEGVKGKRYLEIKLHDLV